MPDMMYRLGQWLALGLFVAACSILLTYSAPVPTDETDRVRAYTRDIEFDYLAWMGNAASLKISQSAAGIPGYLNHESSKVVVSDYLWAAGRITQVEDALNRIYADPAFADKRAASANLNSELSRLNAQQDALAPLAEGVLQAQVSLVAADLGLTTLGQPIPPVLYHSTAVPDALIVSPRNHIEQTANISITAGLPADSQAALESRVEAGLDVSALVVPIGGIGVYPTMIMRSTDLSWLTSTIAHEWTHNYLEFRPLGLLYDHTPELRTMNETTADIVGGEVGQEVIRRFYPELKHAWTPAAALTGMTMSHASSGPALPEAASFDFRSEMHATRVAVDAMLAAGKVADAEQYMESRRQVFVQNGYFIRRLNQAYFAFYGAYAEEPGGPAGEDPVGPAVRSLRTQSRSLADFLNRVSWMTSFDQLKKAVGE
jgi:hypothetical protein